MIDNPATVATLLRQLEHQPPVAAFPTKELVRILRRGGVKASVDRALSITRVFYARDEGGICCDVIPGRTNEVFIVSLTHLRLAPHHPLYPAVVAYQRERVTRLAIADA